MTASKPVKPRKLTDKRSRERARRVRDRQWHFMERVAECGTLWFCIWNKNRLPEAPDEWRDGLITGLEIQGWIDRHRSWFRCGKWHDDRYGRPVQLTRAGRQALRHRGKYDMEPVFGGLVEPGWQAFPAERRAS